MSGKEATRTHTHPAPRNTRCLSRSQQQALQKASDDPTRTGSVGREGAWGISGTGPTSQKCSRSCRQSCKPDIWGSPWPDVLCEPGSIQSQALEESLTWETLC